LSRGDWKTLRAFALLQAKVMRPIIPTTNLIVARLSQDDVALLEPRLTRVELTPRQVLANADIPIDYVYFPENGIASVVEVFSDGGECEVGLIGYEGLSGIPLVLGVDRTPCRVYMQVNGTTALRITTADFLQSMHQSFSLSATLYNYAHVVSVQAANTAAVNARFDIPTRLARWLLMCHDRVTDDDLALTHDMIAIMLGVRRPGVTVALQNIEATGAISVHRGRTTVVNRVALERLATGAYGMSEKEYQRLLGPFGK
jgi:CRP-like cAMP-binding protein